MSSSKSFIFSCLIFRTLIHLEVCVCVYGVTKCSSFILLQVIDQFSQQHLLKRFSFLHCIFLASFVKDKVSIGAWIYPWAFYLEQVSFNFMVAVTACSDFGAQENKDCPSRQYGTGTETEI